jgi:ABC-type glycerol-3-phosphate transport system substrate-binding protein
MKITKTILAMVTTLLLVGCGGGGATQPSGTPIVKFLDINAPFTQTERTFTYDENGNRSTERKVTTFLQYAEDVVLS